MTKKCRPHLGKKPKIDLWEITGCGQIQEIERPAEEEKTFQTSGIGPTLFPSEIQNF
jgi:hypothetical protein